MALILAALFFAAFVADVVVGALSGTAFLSDVGQMLLLFASSIAFTAAILRAEAKSITARHKTVPSDHDPRGG